MRFFQDSTQNVSMPFSLGNPKPLRQMFNLEHTWHTGAYTTHKDHSCIYCNKKALPIIGIMWLFYNNNKKWQLNFQMINIPILANIWKSENGTRDIARERSDQARGSEATEGGRVWEGGVPPPTVGSFCIFGLKIVQSGAYLERKFGLKVWNEWR